MLVADATSGHVPKTTVRNGLTGSRATVIMADSVNAGKAMTVERSVGLAPDVFEILYKGRLLPLL